MRLSSRKLGQKRRDKTNMLIGLSCPILYQIYKIIIFYILRNLNKRHVIKNHALGLLLKSIIFFSNSNKTGLSSMMYL